VVLSTRRLPRTTKIGLASGLSGLVSDLGHVDLEARTWIEFDPLGQLNRFQTTILANNTTEWFKVYGMVDGSTLHLDVAARGIQQSKQMQLPPGSFVNNEFSPLAMMPNLRVGQRWTLPVYHPLDFMNKPTILQAEVVREDYLVWGDLARVVRVVEYTTDKSDEPRGRVWVHRDGRVLQQEVRLLGSRLTFVRMAEDEAETISSTLKEDWRANLGSRYSRKSARDRQ